MVTSGIGEASLVADPLQQIKLMLINSLLFADRVVGNGDKNKKYVALEIVSNYLVIFLFLEIKVSS